MTRILLASLLAAFAGSAFADCEFGAHRDFDLPADGVKLVKLAARAGDLRIAGAPGLKQVEVRGKACASSAEALEMLQLKNDRNGSTLRIEGTQPENVASLFGNSYAYIDLDIRVPEGMDLDVSDSSGDTDIADVGSVKLDDSSGDIRIHAARGDLRLNDSSGNINVSQIEGTVLVERDSSGDINIDSVRRDVTINDDSSGDIEISNVDGSARVDNDSSGDIRFRHIGGSAEVGTDSSGSIDANGVKGDFTVRRKSGGRNAIQYSNVGGKVSLPGQD